MNILDKFPPPSLEAVTEYHAAHKAREEAEDRAKQARKGLELYWLKQERDTLREAMPDGDGWEWAVTLYEGRSHLVLLNQCLATALVVNHPGYLDGTWRCGTETRRTPLTSLHGYCPNFNIPVRKTTDFSVSGRRNGLSACGSVGAHRSGSCRITLRHPHPLPCSDGPLYMAMTLWRKSLPDSFLLLFSGGSVSW